MLSCNFVLLFLISAGDAFQISAPRSVASKASVSWNRNDGDPDDSVFARRLVPAIVGDELPESPGSLLSGTIDVEFPVTGTYLIEIRTPQPEFRLLAESDTIFAEVDSSDSDTSESPIATSSSIGHTLSVPVSTSSSIQSVQPMRSSTTVSSSSILPTLTNTVTDVTVFIANTATDSSDPVSTTLAHVVQGSVNASSSNQITLASTNSASTKAITSIRATITPLFISLNPNLATIGVQESTSVSTMHSGKLVSDTPHTSTGLYAPTPTSTSPTSSVPSRSHIPQIIGGILGSFLPIIFFIVLFIFYRRRHLRRPSSQPPDIEERKESETLSRPGSMDQPQEKPQSHASMLTSVYSPVSQRTFYLSYTDGFLRRLDSDPHRHGRDPSMASSDIASHLTSNQFMFTPPDDYIVGEPRTTMWRPEEHVQRMEAEHESDWALDQLDEPPPVYKEVMSRTQSIS